jgi:hypothetical protein
MNQRFLPHAKALRATLLCAALVPLVAACGAKSSGSSSTAAGAAGTTHAASASAATAQAVSSAAAGSAAKVSATCPTAAAISAAAGGKYPAPAKEVADGDTSCDYSDASTGANLSVIIAPASGITAAGLQEAIASQAQALGGKAKQVSGIGTTAYILTGNDASTNSDGIATTMVGALSSKYYIIVGGELSPTADEAVARLVLGQ